MNEILESLIQTELQNAEIKFKPINSSHEGWAIIKEEIDELEENFNEVRYGEECLWKAIKLNNKLFQIAGIEQIYDKCIEITKEAIQVAAMCKRFEKDLNI